MSGLYPPGKARDKATLEQQIMDAGIAKNDAEWWAMREIERLREVIQRGEYYINRLEAANRGHVVRDLDEACNAWESFRARLKE
jgi:hypothetical protein